jgi:hypothetical protein
VVNGTSVNFMRADGAPALANTTVTPGSYTYSAITVDAQGRLTAAGSGTAPVAPPVGANPTATVSGTVVNGVATTYMRSDAAPALANTTVTAGSYTLSSITVDAQGRLTFASNGAAVTSVTAGTGLSGGTITASGTIALSSPVAVANGGTGVGTLTVNRPLLGNGTAAVVSSTIMTDDGSTLTVSTNQVIGAAVTAPPTHTLVLNDCITTPQATSIGQGFLTVASDATGPGLFLEGYGTAGNSVVVGRRARGTAAAPTAVQSGDILLALNGAGRAATNYAGANTNIVLQAAENFTATAQGTQIVFNTVPTGTTGSSNVLTLSNNRGTFNGSVSASGGIVGVTDGSDAAAGMVGEYLAGVQAAVAMTSSSPITIASVALTAGDWDVNANLVFTPAGGATATLGIVALNTTTNTLPASVFDGSYTQVPVTAAGQFVLVSGTKRFSLAAAATVFLVGFVQFTGGTCTGQGFVRARRVR